MGLDVSSGALVISGPNKGGLSHEERNQKRTKKIGPRMGAKKKKKAKRDACYSKVKARYTRNGGTWPSAYGSGALVKCRKVGAKNWGNKSGKSKKK